MVERSKKISSSKDANTEDLDSTEYAQHQLNEFGVSKDSYELSFNSDEPYMELRREVAEKADAKGKRVPEIPFKYTPTISEDLDGEDEL